MAPQPKNSPAWDDHPLPAQWLWTRTSHSMDPRQVLKTEVTCVWKWLKCPSTEEWIKKMWYRYIMEYYSAIKKEWNNAFCSSMERPRQCHTEWSKSDREGEISYDIPYMWNLKRNDTNDLTKQKETHRLRKWAYSCQVEKIVREFGMVMYTLLYLKWITNEDLLYSTWNSAQCYVAVWMVGGLGKNGYKYMYDWVPLLFTWNYHNIVNRL